MKTEVLTLNDVITKYNINMLFTDNIVTIDDANGWVPYDTYSISLIWDPEELSKLLLTVSHPDSLAMEFINRTNETDNEHPENWIVACAEDSDRLITFYLKIGTSAGLCSYYDSEQDI